MRTSIHRLVAAVTLACAPVLASAQGLILGVSEGTSGGLDHAQVINKYQGLADVIGKSIRQKVNVVFIREFAALEEGMKAGRFDFVIARPSDYPARGLRDYGFQFIATAKPDGQCHIVVPKDSPLKTLADVKGKRIALPEQAAYMTKLCRAELRDRGINLAAENVIAAGPDRRHPERPDGAPDAGAPRHRHLGQMLEVQPRVDLRGGDVGMAQQFLHGAQVAAGLQHVAGK
jgi:ABC-type nitrate/sulfonate/bicarbonate transport system substrate-binding protein